ncbi:MAG: hypothetical protein LLG04_10890 [Parachlamydia sp.]|nr:hypothetical protein [Parachlamydia sp.]
MEGDLFLSACFLSPPKMFGKRLRPFSVAHYYLLKHFRNPYLVGGTCTKQELLFAVYICSLTWEDCIAWIASNSQWTDRAFWWAWRWRKTDFAVASTSFEKYIEEFTATAERTEKIDENGEPTKKISIALPLEWHLATFLMNELHFSESEAWNMPFNRARCYFDVIAERGGDDTLMSEYDRQLILLRQKAEAAHAAGDISEEAKWDEKTQKFIDEYKAGRI